MKKGLAGDKMSCGIYLTDVKGLESALLSFHYDLHATLSDTLLHPSKQREDTRPVTASHHKLMQK